MSFREILENRTFDPKKFKVGDRVSLYGPDSKNTFIGTVKKTASNGLFIEKDVDKDFKPVFGIEIDSAFYNNDYGYIIKKLKGKK